MVYIGVATLFVISVKAVLRDTHGLVKRILEDIRSATHVCGRARPQILGRTGKLYVKNTIIKKEIEIIKRAHSSRTLYRPFLLSSTYWYVF